MSAFTRTVSLTILLLLLGAVGIADAHRVFNRTDSNGKLRIGAYSSGSFDASDDDVLWAFDNGFPSGPFRQAVRDGAGTWNSLSRRFQFAYDSRDLSTERQFDGEKHYCSEQRQPVARNGRSLGLVFWEALPSSGDRDVLARAGVCFKRQGSGYRLLAFRMAYDRTQPNWYRGESGSVPSESIDARSVATHEFGHSTGFLRHYDGKNSIPTGSDQCASGDQNRQTMCSLTYRGQARQRTLGRHDRHTFEGAYTP